MDPLAQFVAVRPLALAPDEKERRPLAKFLDPE